MNLLDEAIAACGGNDWIFTELLPDPKQCTTRVADIGNPIKIPDFISGALRSARSVKKSRIWVDVHMQVPEASLANVFTLVRQKNLSELPQGLRPAAAVPDSFKDDIKYSVHVENNEDGTMDVAKVYYIEGKSPMSLKLFMPMVTGTAYAPQWREGPWAFKKGFQSLLDRLAGYHINWFSVTQRPKLQRADSQKWSVPLDVLRAGVDFVNKEAPTDNDENQQWLWIQEQIMEDSGSVLAGWPESKVQRIAENKSKASGANATLERFFPMNVMDLHPVWVDVLLPLLFPLLAQYGMLILGLPHVGKTPAFICIAMAMGRYWCRTRPDDVSGPPGWRRAKAFDALNKRAGQLQEGVFLDDPDVESISLGDFKSLFTVGEDRTVRCRYHDAKLARNAVTGTAQNELELADEPPRDCRTVVSADEGLKLFKKPWDGAKNTHIMAILKRVFGLVVGSNAAYVRFPSPSEEETIHRIDLEDFHKDWLVTDHKEYYGLHLSGIQRKYPGFDERVAQEQAIIDAAMAERGSMTAQAWVKKCNATLQMKLMMRASGAAAAGVAAMPASTDALPSTPEQEGTASIAPDADGVYRIPIPAMTTETSSRFSRFALGDGSARKRIRHKRADGAASSQEAMTVAADQGMQDGDGDFHPLSQMSLAADREHEAASGSGGPSKPLDRARVEDCDVFGHGGSMDDE